MEDIMKKIIIALSLVIALALVGCESKQVDSKSSFEIIQELKDLKDVEGLINTGIIRNDEAGIEKITRWLSNDESEFELEGFIDGAIISPMMSVDARGVLILRFDGTEDSESVMKAMENFRRFLICVQIENYEIVNVGNTYMFAGVADNTELVETFKTLNFEREALTEESSINEVSMKIIENADIALSTMTNIYNDEFMLGQLPYLLGEDLGFDTSVIESAIVSYGYESDQFFAIFKTSDLDKTVLEAANLDEFYKLQMNKDFSIKGSIATFGNFVVYTNSVEEEVLKDVIKNLK